jgi:hypothetical protein
MTIAGKHLFDEMVPTRLHCTSRCVRLAYMVGDKFDHRKTWIEERLQLLSRCCAVEVVG